MADTELQSVRLEDGEIDESNDSSGLPEQIESAVNDSVLKTIEVEKTDVRKNNEKLAESAVSDPKKPKQKKKAKTKNSNNTYFNDEQIDYIDEDEMLCVRGASPPVTFVVERRSYRRKSPEQDCDIISVDTTPPKKRKTSGKRRRKRITPKKIIKDKRRSSDERDKSNSKDRSPTLQDDREKLPQLCKFYLQDSCAKRSKCEYMHSEFPCKYYYLGLNCEDEITEAGCKLSHGGLLSSEMLNILTRHIHTAPMDVLGQEFFDLRSKMTDNEIIRKLQQVQDDLATPRSESKDVFTSAIDSSTFINTLKEKLGFLTEDQLNGLQKLGISKETDLFNLTIAQLNAIGIHAIQIEALQMSFAAGHGQDTDMRNILPTNVQVPVEQVPSFEIVCYNEGNSYGQNWFDEEERPLVIDETYVEDNENKEKSPDDGDIEIDVLGNTSPESNSSINEGKEINVIGNTIEDGIAIDEVVSIESPNACEPIIFEKSQKLQVLSNAQALQKENQSMSYSEAVVINEEEKEDIEEESNTEASLEKLESIVVEENPTEFQVFPHSEELKEDLLTLLGSENIVVEKNKKELQVPMDSEGLQGDRLTILGSENIVVEENKKELQVPMDSEGLQGDLLTILGSENIVVDSEGLQEKSQIIIGQVIIVEKNQELGVVTQNSNEYENKTEIDFIEQSSSENLLVVEKMIEEEIEVKHLQEKGEQSQSSPTKQLIPAFVCEEGERSYTPPPLPLGSPKENKSSNTPPPLPIEPPIEIKKNNTPPSENIVAEIDLTDSSPPRRLFDHHKPNDSKPRGNMNPFHRKLISPVRENRQRVSPVKEQRRQYAYPANTRHDDHQMQGDNSSEDWDADEKSDNQSPPKEIASPDQSEDESTHFVADGACPELPRRTKNLDNYQPAVEIDARLTYPPMEYKLYEIYMPEFEVNKPTFMDKLIKSNSTNPLLKKFIEKEKNHGVLPQAEYSFFPPNISHCDPRLRSTSEIKSNCPDQSYNASRTLYSYVQGSQWYQELKSNLKIQINHSVSDLVRALNFFHKDPSPQKIFDIFQIECAGVLLEVMRNVGIFVDVNGNIIEEPNFKQLRVPVPQLLQTQSLASTVGCSAQVPKPGLLGYAPPGVPHPMQNKPPMSDEHSFARQAFGRDCFCSNNNDFQPNQQSFYVGGRYGMNRNQEPNNFNAGFEPGPYKRQPQRRNFKRH